MNTEPEHPLRLSESQRRNVPCSSPICLPVTSLQKALRAPESSPKLYMATGLVASILPDTDLIYFFLIDHRLHHHHTYWTHLPVFWVSILALAITSCLLMKKRAPLLLVLLFGVNIVLHLALDSIVGDIWWLAPFLNKPFAMFSVPAQYSPWYLNFILHWSFWLEIAITFAAYAAWRPNRVAISLQTGPVGP
ncbi:MAG: metal-dependent hydrolase [Sulfuricella sp.]|nr:metal-dependent hydrolase [Sulfuricella sp.]